MKFRVFIFLFFIISQVFSQSEIYFLKDLKNEFTINNIQNKDFKLLTETISDAYNKETYWFKIPKSDKGEDVVFQILNIDIHDIKVYKNYIEIKKSDKERYVTYKFNTNSETYIKIKPKKESYFPIVLLPEKEFNTKERKEFLFIGLYFGFAIIIILYNLIYYFVLKDETSLYYALFLVFISTGFFITDGFLNYFNVPESLMEVLIVLNYLFLAYFSSKFASTYLQLDNYYPKLKKFTITIGLLSILFGLGYLIFQHFFLLIILKVFVFSLFTIYWTFSVIIFRKNLFTKIFVIAYMTILFSAINYYILKLVGHSTSVLDIIYVKIGGFIEMIVLSIAVLYRIKILKEENDFMTSEIIKYSKQITQLTINNQNEIKEDLKNDLSIREKEIFDLIIIGNSNKLIADSLNISVNTVKFHVKNIYEKLHIKSRKEAITLQKSFN